MANLEYSVISNSINFFRKLLTTFNYNAPSKMHNHLLTAIPVNEFNRISLGLELVEMPLVEVLCESNEKLNHVYFPTTSISSLVYV